MYSSLSLNEQWNQIKLNLFLRIYFFFKYINCFAILEGKINKKIQKKIAMVIFTCDTHGSCYIIH